MLILIICCVIQYCLIAQVQGDEENMMYKAVQPHTKEEAKIAFTRGTSAEITDALLGVTYYVADWQWVQTTCLRLLERPDIQTKWVAIQCLGHLATFHHILDLDLVLPALRSYESHPELKGVVSNAFDDIVVVAIEDTSYSAKNWNELPQRIKQPLIKEGIFTSSGKRVWRLFRRPWRFIHQFFR